MPTAKTASSANEANRISQFGNASYNFDEKGQTTTKTDSSGTTTYNWDARGRMTSANLPNGQIVSYSYDALGRRSSRTANSQTTSFVYDGQDVVQDKQGTNTQAEYINGLGIDDKLKVSNTSGSLYFLKDHLGSTQGLTGASGNVAEWQRYEAFGNSSVSSSLTRYGYTGRERDEQTGLNYYRARWYDAQQGRFISEDPIGFEGGVNFYAYAQNNPLLYLDPQGLSVLTFFEGLGIGIAKSIVSTLVFYAVMAGITALVGGTGGTALVVAGVILAAYGIYQIYSQLEQIGKVWDCDPDKRDYLIGELIGEVVGALLVGGMAAKGREISFGKNFRVAPFGNRTGNKIGEFPHYHRRGPRLPNGDTVPGQGIGRHRPWETKSPDTTFGDRF